MRHWDGVNRLIFIFYLTQKYEFDRIFLINKTKQKKRRMIKMAKNLERVTHTTNLIKEKIEHKTISLYAF